LLLALPVSCSRTRLAPPPPIEDASNLIPRKVEVESPAPPAKVKEADVPDAKPTTPVQAAPLPPLAPARRR